MLSFELRCLLSAQPIPNYGYWDQPMKSEAGGKQGTAGYPKNRKNAPVNPKTITTPLLDVRETDDMILEHQDQHVRAGKGGEK
jgi:hypothetical protein